MSDQNGGADGAGNNGAGGGGAGGGGAGGGGTGEAPDYGGGAEGAGPGGPVTGGDESDPHEPPAPNSDALRTPPLPPPPPSTLPQNPPAPTNADVNPGQDNHVSPAAGTPFTGALPTWVLEITKNDQIDVEVTYPKGGPKTKRKIKLYWFRFLGVNFMTGGQGGVNGVNRGLLKKLLSAQENLYRQYRELMGAPADDADDQKKFKAFTGAKEVIGGQGPRGGGNHRDGSACDIEYTASPWVPVLMGGKPTGEPHNGSNNEWSRVNVWEPCLDIYHRASFFCVGHRASPSKSRDPALTYDAFKETHDSLVKYLSYRYPNGVSGNLTEETEASFLARVAAEKSTALKDSKLCSWNKERTALDSSALSDANEEAIKAVFAQIQADHQTMRYGMVTGKLSVVNDSIDPAATNYREPCKGFLMIKKEVALALLKTGLRWGGQDFGDMMHFDMGLETLNELFDISVSSRAAQLATELASSTDEALTKLKDAATAVKNAADMAGAAANEASLAGTTAKEDACWAAVTSANSALAKAVAAKATAKKAADDKAASAEKKQKAMDGADSALAAAKKAEDEAKAANAM